MANRDARKDVEAEHPGNAVTDKRAVRTLGRGLQDVSHLFLSRGQPAPAAQTRIETPESTAPTFLLRGARAMPSIRQLRAVLREDSDALGERLKPIDTQLSCDHAGDIDLLAVDEANRLVIVDVDAAEGDGLLLRALIHYSWLARNIMLLRSKYDGRPIDFSAPPRVFVLARQFPPMFVDAVRDVKAPEILCIRFHSLDLGGGVGIFFERLDAAGSVSRSVPEIVFT